MTSANSSSKMKLFLLTCRNRLWLLVLGFVIFLFALPVASGLMLQNFGEIPTDAYAATRITALLTYLRGVSAFAMVVAAVLCGVVCFRYQHKRKQVDFYNSMPLKRGAWFGINYLSGLVIFLVCYLIPTVINCLVIAVSDFSTWFYWPDYLQDIGIILCFSFMLYSLVVFAMNISGTTLTALLVLIVVNSVLPALIGLKELLYSLFFDSYLSAMHDLTSLMINSSPIAKLVSVTARTAAGDISALSVIVILVLGVVFLVAALLLGIKRPSESAGQAFVFRPVSIVVRYLISIVCTFYFAVFFYVTGMQSLIWLFFGVAAGAALSYHFLNIWFTLDFKTITNAKNWLGALIVFVVVSATYACFLTDITDYDGYLPEQDEVASVGIYLSDLDYYGSEVYNNSNYFYQSEYQSMLQNTDVDTMYQMTDEAVIGAAINMAQNGIDELKRLKQMEADPGALSNEDSADRGDMPVDTVNNYQNKCYFWVVYTLDNGKQVGRAYSVYMSDLKPDLLTIMDSAEYRDNQFIINQYAKDGKVYLAEAGNFGYNTYLPDDLSLAEMRQIATVYAEEHRNLSLESRSSKLPIGYINMRIYFNDQPEENFIAQEMAGQIEDGSETMVWAEVHYPIYAEFTETRALINQAAGMDVFTSDVNHVAYIESYEQLPVDDISGENAYSYSNQVGEMSEEVYSEQYGADVVVNRYDDAGTISEIYNSTVPSEAISYNCFAISSQWLDGTWYRVYYDTGYETERVGYQFCE
jgi:ABC-2 type transport system permease protein